MLWCQQQTNIFNLLAKQPFPSRLPRSRSERIWIEAPPAIRWRIPSLLVEPWEHGRIEIAAGHLIWPLQDRVALIPILPQIKVVAEESLEFVKRYILEF